MEDETAYSTRQYFPNKIIKVIYEVISLDRKRVNIKSQRFKDCTPQKIATCSNWKSNVRDCYYPRSYDGVWNPNRNQPLVWIIRVKLYLNVPFRRWVSLKRGDTERDATEDALYNERLIAVTSLVLVLAIPFSTFREDQCDTTPRMAITMNVHLALYRRNKIPTKTFRYKQCSSLYTATVSPQYLWTFSKLNYSSRISHENYATKILPVTCFPASSR